MTAGALHPSGITRQPPPHNSPALPDTEGHKVTFADGRIAWPGIFQYETDEKVSDVPPAPGVSYKMKIYDRARFDALSATGALRDPLHTGREISEIIEGKDNDCR